MWHVCIFWLFYKLSCCQIFVKFVDHGYSMRILFWMRWHQYVCYQYWMLLFFGGLWLNYHGFSLWLWLCDIISEYIWIILIRPCTSILPQNYFFPDWFMWHSESDLNMSNYIPWSGVVNGFSQGQPRSGVPINRVKTKLNWNKYTV
jgi:hypothetical protein